MDKTYWQQRALQREDDAQRAAEVVQAEMAAIIARRRRSIMKEIDDFYIRYATEEGLTKREAKKLLTTDELRDFMTDLNEFRKQSMMEVIPYQVERELARLSYRSRISRLDAMNARLEMELIELYGSAEGLAPALQTHLGDIYQSTYLKTVYDIAKGTGELVTVAKLSESAVHKIVSHNWSGKEWSQRIWTHQARQSKRIRRILADGVQAGRHSTVIARELAKTFDVSLNQAKALTITETNHFHEEASQTAYVDAGIDKYEILATLDSRTSSICRQQDGKVYKQSEYSPGDTAPPFHVRCRSTTIPVLPDEYMKDEKRRAGRRLIEKMTYEEWEKKYVK